jgi:hypothetical protein
LQEPQPAPLSSFAAKLILEASLAKNPELECPVSMEPLRNLREVGVGSCGHICAAEVCSKLTKCALCRQPTAWTVIKIE